MPIQVRFQGKRHGLSSRHIKTALKKALEDLGFRHMELSVLFVDDSVIEDLNLRYRKKKAPTNVLAFPMMDPDGMLLSKMLGDIVISLDTAQKEADQEGVALENRVMRLLAHGLLHLLGYDHQTEEEEQIMEERENRLVRIMGGVDG